MWASSRVVRRVGPWRVVVVDVFFRVLTEAPECLPQTRVVRASRVRRVVLGARGVRRATARAVA